MPNTPQPPLVIAIHANLDLADKEPRVDEMQRVLDICAQRTGLPATKPEFKGRVKMVLAWPPAPAGTAQWLTYVYTLDEEPVAAVVVDSKADAQWFLPLDRLVPAQG